MRYSVLVTTKREFKDWEECYKNLATMLEKEKKVKPGYWESVLEREKSFPTGLQITPNIGIAIPHSCDPSFSIEPSIAVALLAKPLEVSSMAQPEEKVMVSVVLMLALVGSEDHLVMLQHMMEIFQDEVLLQNLLEIKDPLDARKLLEDKLAVNN
ncbi:MAG: PTS sugar transporter subunit IIA [Clostridia bacterium]|nr:PTS sugar transporter subunit IIA [Clostridia bacterium]